LAECRAPLATAAAVVAGLAAIAYASWTIAPRIAPWLPEALPWAAPAAACAVAGALYASKLAVEALGGPAPFFCGGRRILASLLGRAPPPEPPGEIVAAGPYGVTRHPVYAATLAAYAGLALALPRLLPGLPLVAAWVVAAAIVEERFLARSPAYREYASRVPRLAPLRLVAWACREAAKRIVPRGGPRG